MITTNILSKGKKSKFKRMGLSKEIKSFSHNQTNKNPLIFKKGRSIFYGF